MITTISPITKLAMLARVLNINVEDELEFYLANAGKMDFVQELESKAKLLLEGKHLYDTSSYVISIDELEPLENPPQPYSQQHHPVSQKRKRNPNRWR